MKSLAGTRGHARCWLAALCLAGILGTTTETLAQTRETDARAAPAHLALLIGINEYEDPAIPSLAGCLTDVEAMNSVLTGRFGFSADEISILIDREATREAILRALERLIATAGPETAVVVHFSGHGSAVKDLDGDESDGWDETLVPHDSGRSRAENRDITDDELDGILYRLAQKTKKITLIMDAAAGGATLSRGSLRVRAAPADYRDDYRDQRRQAEQFAPVIRPGLNLDEIVLASAGRQGSAVSEGSFGTLTAGIFSYYLTLRLWEASAGATWADVFPQVASDVLARVNSQPVFEGDKSKFIFDSPRSSPRTYFVAEPGSRGVVVRGGALHGLSAGSVLELFPQGTVDFAAAPVARVRLVNVDVTTSIGEVVEGEVGGTSWAILAAVRYEKSKVRVRLDLSGKSELAELLPARLRESDLIELVDSEYDLLVRETQGELQVEGSTTSAWRTVISSSPADDAVAAVLEHVGRRAQWLSLLELRNPSPAFEVELALLAEDESLQSRLGRALFREGERFTVRVANAHTEPLYLVILALSAYDNVDVVYPGRRASETVAPGEAVTLQFEAFIEPGLPSTEDVFKVIASTDPISAVSLNQQAARGVKLANSIDQLLDYRALGSLGETSVDPRTWATATAYLEVVASEGGLILWVDDRPANNQWVRESFRRQGWQSIVARSTREALEILETERIDVIISDFSRPRDELAGYGILEELAKRDGSPPLIYYVADYTDEQAEEARRRGALGETNNAQVLLKLMEQARGVNDP